MKVLSVRQPWATALIEGYMYRPHREPPYREIKDVENRTWITKYRGPLLIHASKKVDLEGVKWLRQEGFQLHPGSNSIKFTVGAIIGRVELVDIVENHHSRWAAAGQYHWVLENPLRFPESLPAKGRLGLWETEIGFYMARFKPVKA